MLIDYNESGDECLFYTYFLVVESVQLETEKEKGCKSTWTISVLNETLPNVTFTMFGAFFVVSFFSRYNLIFN